MYEYIKGQVTHSGGDYIVIENQGIGYKILTSQYTQSAYLLSSEDVICYTELIVREDAMFLVGFSSREERGLFDKLISVSGVGTKVALAMLSHSEYPLLARMIVQGDVKGLQGAPGVGKKTAERMVLELKDKVDVYTSGVAEMVYEAPMETSTAYQDAIDALISLGYVKSEAQRALVGLDVSGMSIEMIIKAALKQMMGL